MPIGEELKPADEVTSWCTKCREMRLHKVKVVPPGRVARVICITCDGEHNYRPNPPNSRRAGAGQKAKASEPNPWKELTTDINPDKVREYKISERFWEGDLIQHRKYGLGVVSEMLDVSKMIVWFENGKKIMVFNKN